MKKLNKKGITLVELIVSFALIAVAVTYFYQTLLTVNKLYKTSTNETNDFVEKTYALRILDKYIETNGVDFSYFDDSLLKIDVGSLTGCTLEENNMNGNNGIIVINVQCPGGNTKYFSSFAYFIESDINSYGSSITLDNLNTIANKYSCNYDYDSGFFYCMEEPVYSYNF